FSSSDAAHITSTIAPCRESRLEKGRFAAARCGTQGECSKMSPSAATKSASDMALSSASVVMIVHFIRLSTNRHPWTKPEVQYRFRRAKGRDGCPGQARAGQ